MAYESPIRICEKITEDIITKTEDGIIEEVKVQVGYDIDKTELVKALEYDRGQYKKGYEDGKKDAVKHGRWVLRRIHEDEYGNEKFNLFCSECDAPAYEFSQPYCHKCGARMEDKVE